MAALGLNQEWSESQLETVPSECPGPWCSRNSRTFGVIPIRVSVPALPFNS